MRAALLMLAIVACPLAAAQEPAGIANLDGKISTLEDFRKELDSRCKTGKPPKRNSDNYFACALIVYEPVERGPGVRGFVFRPIFAVERNGEKAWVSWQSNPYKQVTIQELFGNVSFKDVRQAEGEAGVMHLHIPVGLIGREENEACKCLVFPKGEDLFGPYNMRALRAAYNASRFH